MDTKTVMILASPDGNYSNILWHNPVILVDSTKQDPTAQTPAQKSFLRNCGTYKEDQCSAVCHDDECLCKLLFTKEKIGH